MVSQLQKRIVLRRKLHILRTLTSSKSVCDRQKVKRSTIIMDALLYIQKLKVKVEAIKRELSNLTAIKTEYLNLINQIHLPKKEVKVVRAGKGFQVRVTCEKGREKLVSILEVFEEMGITVLQARVSCNFHFAMEAIVVPQEQDALDVKNITQALLTAIEREGGEETDRNMETSFCS